MNGRTTKEKRIPDSFSNRNYHINNIGTNINQLTQVANYKNMRNPNANLEREIRRASELMLELIEIINAKSP